MSPPQITSAVPILLSPDIGATVRFMESALGFRCRHQQPGMAILCRDDVEVMFTACLEASAIAYSSCRLQVSGIDALHAEIAARVEIHPRGRLRATEYGTREFGIIEPHGALMTFVERAPPARSGGRDP